MNDDESDEQFAFGLVGDMLVEQFGLRPEARDQRSATCDRERDLGLWRAAARS